MRVRNTVLIGATAGLLIAAPGMRPHRIVEAPPTGAMLRALSAASLTTGSAAAAPIGSEHGAAPAAAEGPPLLLTDSPCPAGWHRTFVDAVGPSGRFSAGGSYCERDSATPPPPAAEGPSTPEALLAHFPEVLTGRISRVVVEEDRRFPRPGATSFKLWVTVEVTSAEKGSARAGQAVTVEGWRQENRDASGATRAFGTIPAGVEPGQRVRLYLYGIDPKREPFVPIEKSFQILDAAVP